MVGWSVTSYFFGLLGVTNAVYTPLFNLFCFPSVHPSEQTSQRVIRKMNEQTNVSPPVPSPRVPAPLGPSPQCLSDSSEPLPAPTEALPAPTEALTAPTEDLPALLEALPGPGPGLFSSFQAN